MKRLFDGARFSWRPVVLVCAAVIAVMAGWEAFAFLRGAEPYGIHDWDVHTAHRYVPVLSLLRYHEGPWWSPWFCGGAAAWGYSESAPNVVSIFFPVYLVASMPVALRIEIIGTTALGFFGAWALTSRHTRSIAVRLLVAVLFAINGRWALQTTAGHAWHLQYAYMPWAFYFFERALDGRMRNAFGAAIALALTAYAGGIYPLPHAALALVCYAVVRAIAAKSARPIGALAVAGIFALLFAAPKLLAVYDTMRRAPRTVDSPEVLDPSVFLHALVDREQGINAPPPNMPPTGWGWHEFGIYVGWAGFAVPALGALLRGGPRGGAHRVTGIAFVALAFGAFHEYAPWTLLHRAPLFASQHVPSRFLFPALLFLGLAFASVFERWTHRLLRRRPWLDLLLLVPVAWIALDVSGVSRTILADSFRHESPPIEAAASFHHERVSPVTYRAHDWASPVYLGILANVGVDQCTAVPPDFPRGAITVDSPAYRGEAYVVNGTGEARVTRFTPNSATVEVTNASPGAIVVYNMNWDPSWRADGAPALDWQHAVAAPVQGSRTVEFRYRPRTLGLGVVLCLVGIALAITMTRRSKPRSAKPAAADGEQG